MPPRPRQKARTQQSSTLGQTVPLLKQHSHSGPSAEEERECFDLDVAGSNVMIRTIIFFLRLIPSIA
jgi:hypothetical protein